MLVALMAFAVVIQKFIIECTVSAFEMQESSLAEQRERAAEIYSFFISIEMGIILGLITAHFRIRKPDAEGCSDLNDSMAFDTNDMRRDE